MSVCTSMSCGRVSDSRRSSNIHGSDQCALRHACGPEATYRQHSPYFFFLSADKHRLRDGDRDVVRFGLALACRPVARWGVVPAWGIGRPTWFSFSRLMSGSSDIYRNQQTVIDRIHLGPFIPLIFPCYAGHQVS